VHSFTGCGRKLHLLAELYNDTDGNVMCFQDYDSDSNPPGHFCDGHTNATGRALPVKAADINQSAPDPYLQCATKCIAMGCVC
jgi:hypothetical protein